MQLRFLLHHSDTSYEGIYTSKAPCVRYLTVLENGLLCSLSLANLSYVGRAIDSRECIGIACWVSGALLNIKAASKPISYRA